MKNLSFPVLVALTLIFSSCAQNIVTNYQDNSENTGKLYIIPNKPMFQASVTLQNILNKDASKLIVAKGNIKTLEIRNIPEGIYGLEFNYNNNQYMPIKDNKFNIIIKKDKTTNKLIQIPPYSLGSYIMTITYLAALTILPLVI